MENYSLELEYNATRNHLEITEYGRNIQKMIEFIVNIEDRERRNAAAQCVVEVMAQMSNQTQKDNTDLRHKLWDHLFIMSGYKLDVDAPFPKPVPEEREVKPHKCIYPDRKIRFKQYGKSIEKMIKATCALEEGNEKDVLTKLLANHLKKLYLNWNRESVNDAMILEHLTLLSGGGLKVAEDYQLSKTSDILGPPKKLNNLPQNSGNHRKQNNFGKNKKFYHKGN